MPRSRDLLFYSAVPSRRRGCFPLFYSAVLSRRREVFPSLLLSRAEYEKGVGSLSSTWPCRVGDGSYLLLFYSVVPSRRRGCFSLFFLAMLSRRRKLSPSLLLGRAE